VRQAGRLALALPGAAFLLVFFAAPLAAVLGEAAGGGVLVRVLADPLFRRGLVNSLALAAGAGAVSLVVGFAVALHLSRLGEAARTGLLFLIALPLTFSGLIVAYGFILAFGRAGFVTLALAEIGLVDPAAFAGFVYSPAGLAFAYSYYLIPRVVMLLVPVLVNFDRTQLAAAESMGAGSARAVIDILLPQVLPTAVAAFCLVAAVALGAYGTALALVGTQINILPLLLYSRISDAGGDFGEAAALSIVLLALCSLVIAAAELFAARREADHAAA
jgi:putative spermidine/putrescine transport system permease protein